MFDFEYLKMRYSKALEDRKRAKAEFDEAQVTVAADKTDFFQKLTLGSGAAIAALISFLATHASGLQPRWMLRVSLLSLAATLLSSSFRTFRYPYYVVQVRKRVWFEAVGEQYDCEQALLTNYPTAPLAGIHFIVDDAGWTQFRQSASVRRDTIETVKRHERKYQLQWQWAERVSLLSVCIAMIALVWLALRNF